MTRGSAGPEPMVPEPASASESSPWSMRASASARRPAAAPGQPSGTPAGHEHAWALMQFELVDDHPVVRQRCETCGHVRRYRAWERYWTPPASARAR